MSRMKNMLIARFVASQDTTVNAKSFFLPLAEFQQLTLVLEQAAVRIGLTRLTKPEYKIN
jgi:hypothetical protein